MSSVLSTISSIPHIQDFAFVLFASQLGVAIQPGPKTQAFLRQTMVGPLIVFAFIMIKNAQYNSKEAVTVGVISLLAFFGYRMLP